MDIVLLEPEDAELIADLANHHYPPNYPMSVDDILDNLEKIDENSFCFGVEHEGKLLGYLMAWIDESMVEGRDDEDVMLVDDIVLNMKSRHQLFRLLNTMISEMQVRGFGKLPIEGSSRPTSGNTFMGHPEALERLGYALTNTSEYYEADFDESLTWVRYEPIQEKDAVIDVDDTLEILFDEELEGVQTTPSAESSSGSSSSS